MATIRFEERYIENGGQVETTKVYTGLETATVEEFEKTWETFQVAWKDLFKKNYRDKYIHINFGGPYNSFMSIMPGLAEPTEIEIYWQVGNISDTIKADRKKVKNMVRYMFIRNPEDLREDALNGGIK